MNSISVFALNGISVELDKDFISLNKLWEMAGNPENQDPRQWARLPQTIRLISQVLTEQGFQDNKENRKFVVVVKRGKCGYTKAIPAIAAEYELYLKKNSEGINFWNQRKKHPSLLSSKTKRQN
jgi:hypothetical protein